MTGSPDGRVVAVCADAGHNFSKPLRASIRLLKGLGLTATRTWE